MADFVQELIKAGKTHLARQFNFKYRCIDDVVSLNNSILTSSIHVLEIKETTESTASECLAVNQITVNNFADIFNCTPVGRDSDLVMAPK